MKKILIINGHPNKETFNTAIVEAYKKGALESSAEVRVITIADLDFSPNLKYGYQKRTELEPDLRKAWDDIMWAEHMVWVHPVWWGGLPAIAKGFIDRLFLPGIAFRYRENSLRWDKLLEGKTAHIITTLDQPGWFYALFFGKPSINQLKKCTLQFCGVKVRKVTYIGPVKSSTVKKRENWLRKIECSGRSYR